MTDIKELIARLRAAARHESLFGDDVRKHVSEQTADLLQSQAERIKELELDLDVQAGSIEAVQAANSRLAAERDTLRAQLAAPAATEPAKIERKIYKDTPEYRSYLDARFTPDQWGGSFELDGHRWAYHWTSFDDAGDFDLIYRWVEPKHSPMPAQDVEASMIKLPEPNYFQPQLFDKTKPYYTEAQLKQAVRDALDAIDAARAKGAK